ncbi:MAG: SDR family NAD(P)-dependent oxidoreductase, partial [Ilumatobacteraceae bacterium]
LQPGDAIDVATLAAELGVADRHRRLLARLLELLAERGMVRATPVGWQVIATDSSVEVDTARLRIAFPDAQTEIALVERCASALPAVLRDDVDALTLLFPGGGFDETRHLYADTPPARVVNALVAAAVSAKASGSLPDRRLRVLEVGAGTGATTAAVLDALPAGVVDYVFTDVSPAFVAAARDAIGSRFAERANMRFGVLDIESDPTSTPLEGDQFDVIVAANVLHATADVAASLANIRRRLVPGGLLVLAEATRPNASVDLTFGLTDGWWRFTDTSCRASHPLLSGAGWEAVLAGSGFGDVAAVRGAGGSDVCGQLVLLATAGTQMSEEWIVVGDTAGLGAAVARRLSARSIPCTVIADGDAEALRQELGRAPAPRRRVVHLVAASPGIGDVTNTALHATVALLDVTQAVIAGNGECELWAVTRGAQAVGADAGTLPAHAPVWGLGRVIAVEHPDRWGGLIDLAPHAEAASAESEAAAIVDTILGARVEDQFALRDGLVFVPRLMRLAHALGEPITCSPEGAYLVTGGLGGLGLKVAHWLAVRGAGTIVLTGRSALAERASWHTLEPGSRAERQVTAIRAIEALGATVVVVAADVADPDAMTSLVGRFGRDLPLLRGVVHCAATLGNASVTSMTAADVDDMFRPKISGTWLLHELTAAMPLDFFVLFSSTTALWGSRDLGHYAAANQFLDAVAHHRRALGLTALSVDWGTWDEMRVASAQDQVAVAGAGLLQMPSDDALAVLGGLLGEAGAIAANVAVASVDWDVLKPVYEARRRRPFLAAVGPARIVERPGRRARHEVKPELALRLAGAEPGARLELIVDFVRDEVARALGIADPRVVDPDQGLFEMGMDSLMSVELKSRLEVALGTHLPSTLTFNYPNISALAGYLVAETIEASHEGAGVAQPAGRAGDSTNTPPANATDDLSEVDLAALLATRLANLQ